MKKIALVCNGLKQAGLEMIVVNLAIGMKLYGLDVAVISIESGPLEKRLRQANIEIKVLSKGTRWPSMIGYIQSFWLSIKMALFLKRKNIQIVNIHGLGPHRIALFASTLARVPFSTFVFHSNYPDLAPVNFKKKQMRRLRRNLCHVNHCIAVSMNVKETAVKSGVIESKKITVINNGIDIDRIRAVDRRDETRRKLCLTEEDIVLIQVGRFEKPKNQDITVRAFKKVLERRLDVKLIFVGDGSNLEAVNKLAYQLSIKSYIHFLGLREDVAQLLGCADIFLLPSSWEGLSISFLEACANSLPTVGANVPGITEIVHLAPCCAKLVPPRDENALANAISGAIEDIEWRSKAKDAALKLVKDNFNAKVMIRDYIDLHNNIG